MRIRLIELCVAFLEPLDLSLNRTRAPRSTKTNTVESVSRTIFAPCSGHGKQRLPMRTNPSEHIMHKGPILYPCATLQDAEALCPSSIDAPRQASAGLQGTRASATPSFRQGTFQKPSMLTGIACPPGQYALDGQSTHSASRSYQPVLQLQLATDVDPRSERECAGHWTQAPIEK